MASTLVENVNGDYYKNLAILTGQPERVKVLVEGNADVKFWQDILSAVAGNKIFDVKPYDYNSDITTPKGKRHILVKAKEGRFNAYYIGCVDSDYDYLLRKSSVDGQIMENCLYMLQTYSYSIENLLCYHETLSPLCCKATGEQTDFDITGYIRKTSSIIYPLLIWALFLESKGDKSFSASKWDDIFPCDRRIYSSENADNEILNCLKKKVHVATFLLEADHFQELDEKQDFESQLIKEMACLPLVKENSYLYVRGHDFYKFIKNTVLEAIHQKMKLQHIQRIKNTQGGQMGDGGSCINEYCKSIVDIETLLSTNYEYKRFGGLYLLIKHDIESIW